VGVSIAVSAGEASGDLSGAGLVSEVARLRDDVRFWGMGGARLRQAGVEIVADASDGGTIGVSETLKTLPAVALRYLRMRSALLSRRPDLFVPVDFGAFNVRLGQIAHSRGISVVYYFPPSSWRRRLRNASKLIACGGKVITPFPWSAELLSAAGVDARFVGHPLLDIVKPTVGRAEFFRELGLDESLPTIGLLPGSRAHEISEHVGPMIGCAEVIHREMGGAQFVVAAANRVSEIERTLARASLGSSSSPVVRVVQARTYDCMAHSDMLISKSGTATLEAAILGTPMVIVYRGTGVMRIEFLFRKSVLEDHIGMPNIVAGRGICPELIGSEVTAARLASVALDVLRDADRVAGMRRELGEVKRKLGEPGGTQRAARALLEMGGLS